jgi:hypothetical protein
MAVNLGKRNINSGVQGNQKTQPIPTGPSTTVGVANDPGVAGGPRNIPQGAFGTEGGGAFAKGLQDMSLSVLDATLDRQTAFVKAQELEKEGEEKNVMAEGKIGARADYEQLRLTADLDTSKGKKEFFKKFGEVIDKWQPLMNGARRQDEYESDLRVIQTEQSIEASKEIYGAGVRINKARAGKAGDDVINENRNVDPRNIWGEIFNSVSEAAGNLQPGQITAIAEEKMRVVIENRITNISNRVQPLGTEQQEIMELINDPFTQHFVGAEFAGKTAEAITKVAKARSENSKEVREAQAEKTKRADFQTELKTILKGETDPDVRFALMQGVYTSFGYTPPTRLTLKPGEGSFVPGAKKPSSEVPLAPIPIKLKDDETAGSFNPDNNSVSMFGSTEEKTPPPLKNDDYMENLAEDNTNILSGTGQARLASFVKNFIPTPTDPNTGQPLARTDKATRFIATVTQEASDSARRDKSRSIPLSDHVNAAAARVPVADRPSTFNYKARAEDIWFDNKNKLTPPRRIVKGRQYEETPVGAKSIRDEMQVDLTQFQKRTEQMESQMIKEGFTKKQITDATGWWSSISDMIGSTAGNVFSDFVDKDTQQARFQFSLLARDFIRLVTLSPRFAVKEQELLEKVFSGPRFMLAPDQALINIRQFLGLVDQRGLSIIDELGSYPPDNPGDNTGRNNLLREMELLKDIQNRAEQFIPDIGGNLTDKQVINMSEDEYNALTDKEHFSAFGIHRAGSPGDVEEASMLQETPPAQETPGRTFTPPPSDDSGTPQGAPKEEAGQLEPLRRAMKSGDFSKVTVADMFEGLALLDLSQMDFDVIKGELASLGEDVPDDLRPKKKKKKQSPKKKAK